MQITLYITKRTSMTLSGLFKGELSRWRYMI
jgi:hypothetical protein